MKKLMSLILVLGSLSVFANPRSCAVAQMGQSKLNLTMNILNKNNIKYSVFKEGYSSYRVVARNKNISYGSFDKTVSKLINSRNLKTIGVDFIKVNAKNCHGEMMGIDISKI